MGTKRTTHGSDLAAIRKALDAMRSNAIEWGGTDPRPPLRVTTKDPTTAGLVKAVNSTDRKQYRALGLAERAIRALDRIEGRS